MTTTHRTISSLIYPVGRSFARLQSTSATHGALLASDDAPPALELVSDVTTNHPTAVLTSNPEITNPLDVIAPSSSNTRTGSKLAKLRPDKYEGQRNNNALNFLREIESKSSVPTTADLLKLRPTKIPTNPTKYKDIYFRTYKSIDRMLDRTQVLELGTELYPLLQSSLSKEKTIKELMKHAWDMQPPKDRKAAEVVLQDVAISQSQLFLLLGNDGSQLNHIMERFNVQIAPKACPLSLSVQGMLSNIEGVKQFLKKQKSASVTVSFQPLLNMGLPPDLRQSISQVAEAYFEILPNETIRITTDSPAKVAKARRLALRATFDELQRFQTRFLIHSSNTSSEPAPVALYPFIPLETPPWTFGDSSVFRMRKVGDWFSTAHLSEAARENGLPPPLTPTSLKELRTILNKWPLNKAKGLSRTIYARTGHILIPTDKSTSAHTLIPPLQGPVDSTQAQGWTAERSHVFNFLPSAPPNIHASANKDQATIQQLVYRTIPTGISRFTPHSGEEPRDNPRVPTSQLKPGSNALIVEFTISPARCSKPVPGTEELASSPNHQNQTGDTDQDQILNEGNEIGVIALEGFETKVNLALPDKPLDLNFTVFDHYRLLILPKSLSEYKTNLETSIHTSQDGTLQQPSIPDSIQYRGRHFYLHSASKIHRSTASSTASTIHNIESSIDIDSDASSISHSMICRDAETSEKWDDFVSRCNQLIQ